MEKTTESSRSVQRDVFGVTYRDTVVLTSVTFFYRNILKKIGFVLKYVDSHDNKRTRGTLWILRNLLTQINSKDTKEP